MILVTGATGILGRLIVLELLKQGKTVRAAKRPTSNTDEVRQSYAFYTDNADDYFQEIEWVDMDFTDLDSLRNALRGVEEIYHCSAQVSFHPKDKRQMYETNIGGTKNLLYIADELRVNKFLFVSSIAVLDGVNEQGLMDENSDFNSKLPHSSYAISKHFSEMEVWRASAEGMNVVVINPGVIIGSGNWSRSSGMLFANLCRLPYSFTGTTGYVDARDVARIAIRLMDNNHFGERYVLVSENKRYIDIANMVRGKMGLNSAKIISEGQLKWLRWITKPFRFAIPIFKMLNKANVQALTTSEEISNKKIKETLDYQFISIEESIDFHLENYKKHKA